MKERCYGINHKSYHLYGARGIKVCPQWLDGGYTSFLRDMGPRPSAEYSLDRIDNNGDYTPENCRWANRYTQGNNTRANITLTYQGKTLTATTWARKLGIPYPTLMDRIYSGKNIEDILHIGKPAAPQRLITYKGVTQTVAQWGRTFGLSRKLINARIRRGWKLEDIFSTPNQGLRRL